jgi:hypothetical protein
MEHHRRYPMPEYPKQPSTTSPETVDKPEEPIESIAWLLGYDSLEDLELEQDEQLIDDD